MKQELKIGRKTYDLHFDYRGAVLAIFDKDPRKKNPHLDRDEREALLVSLPDSAKRQLADNVVRMVSARTARIAACETFHIIADGGELRLSINGADVRFNALGDGVKKVRITDDAELPRECGHKELARICGEIVVHGYDCEDTHGSIVLSGQFTVTRSDNGNFYFVKGKK